MDRSEFAARIDHTALGPTTTRADVERVLDEADVYGTNACVPPCYVAEAAAYAPEVTLVTVIGFPHGQHATATRRAEAEVARRDGADELDAVINVGRLKGGEDDAVVADLAAVVDAVAAPVKAIVETALLTEAEKRRACEAAVAAGADYVKTSTGFADGGATVADVRLLSEYLPVKASGGIRTFEEATAMLEAGASRIGTSSGAAIVEGFPDG
ncbi:MAG: deoxyribose-phosphate aldolase [Salinigranum sp.]